MGLISKILRDGTDGRLTWWCPGCDSPHAINHGEGAGPRWTWNGDAVKPTFSPSVLTWWSEPANLDNEEALQRDIQAARESGGKVPQVDKRCHSFVKDGQMQFLGDCTHAMAGQTVDIPTWPWGED